MLHPARRPPATVRGIMACAAGNER